MPEEQSDRNPKQQVNAALALAERGDFSELAAITRALTHDGAAVRLRAAYCCQRIGPPQAIEALSHMARGDPKSENRNQSIYALAAIGRAAVVPALIDTLADEESERREDGRTALYYVLGADVLPLLADDGERDQTERDRLMTWWLQQAPRFDPSCAFALGETASPGIFIRELRAATATLPDAYLDALHDWTGQDFGQAPRSKVARKWEKWWSVHQGSYEPGRKHFFGHPLPLTAP